MRLRTLKRAALLILLVGTNASCAISPSDAGLCEALPVEALASALLAHPDTNDAVGNAGADVVIGFRAGCGA